MSWESHQACLSQLNTLNGIFGAWGDFHSPSRICGKNRSPIEKHSERLLSKLINYVLTRAQGIDFLSIWIVDENNIVFEIKIKFLEKLFLRNEVVNLNNLSSRLQAALRWSHGIFSARFISWRSCDKRTQQPITFLWLGYFQYFNCSETCRAQYISGV